jgi:hypothetical protein
VLDLKSEELIAIDAPISTALIVAGMTYEQEINRTERKNIKEHAKYKLYKYYGEEMEEPNSFLSERDKDLVNIITNMVIEYYDKQK